MTGTGCTVLHVRLSGKTFWCGVGPIVSALQGIQGNGGTEQAQGASGPRVVALVLVRCVLFRAGSSANSKVQVWQVIVHV